MEQPTGQHLIDKERQRQKNHESWTVEHEDDGGIEALLLAALCYRDAEGPNTHQPSLWPWDSHDWQPRSRVRNLAQAGGLYQAAWDAAAVRQDETRCKAIQAQVEYCAKLIDQQPVAALPNMKKPCADCPFRKDSLKGWLGSARMGEILETDSFVCHKHHNRQCAGHMLIRGQDNQFVQLAKRMDIPLSLSGEDLVFATPDDCLRHHSS